MKEKEIKEIKNSAKKVRKQIRKDYEEIREKFDGFTKGFHKVVEKMDTLLKELSE